MLIENVVPSFSAELGGMGNRAVSNDEGELSLLWLARSTLAGPVSGALDSLSPSISLFLSVGPGLPWMKFQQGYEGMVHGV